MGISSAMGVGAIQPGVVADSSQRPASPYEGQLIFQRDTNALYLYDGSAWVMVIDADQAPGLQLVKTQTIGSAVASVTVSSAFSADYDNYLITVGGGTMSTNGHCRLSLGSTATQYYGSLIYSSYNSTTVLGATDNNQNYWSWGGSTGEDHSGYIILLSPYLSKHTEVWSRTRYSTVYGTYTGILTDTTSYTAFTLTCNSGTLTGGTIRVYGYRNS